MQLKGSDQRVMLQQSRVLVVIQLSRENSDSARLECSTTRKVMILSLRQSRTLTGI